MKDVTFQVAQRDDYPRLAEWLVQMSQAPEQHCLHTWSGQNAKELQQQLLSYWDESELCYVMALRDGKLVGAMGSEYDEVLERGWLHGPHVATGDWELSNVAILPHDGSQGCCVAKRCGSKTWRPHVPQLRFPVRCPAR